MEISQILSTLRDNTERYDGDFLCIDELNNLLQVEDSFDKAESVLYNVCQFFNYLGVDVKPLYCYRKTDEVVTFRNIHEQTTFDVYIQNNGDNTITVGSMLTLRKEV